MIYIDKGETANIFCKLENTFNLKIDLIDDNQANFTLSIDKSGVVDQNDKTITGIEYGSTKGIITHTPTNKQKGVQIEVVAKMQSIVQGFRDTNLPDGDYTVNIEDQTYRIELINYYDDMTYSLGIGENSSVVELGDDSKEYKMLVVKYHKNLKIDENVKLTAKQVRRLNIQKRNVFMRTSEKSKTMEKSQ